MRPDSEVKRDVEQELQWDADIDASDIGVSVKGGVVTLTGFVRSYAQKWQAERAAKRVAGVVGVANDIEVRIPSVDQRPDPEIARDAVAALQRDLPEDGTRILRSRRWTRPRGGHDAIAREEAQRDKRDREPPAALIAQEAGTSETAVTSSWSSRQTKSMPIRPRSLDAR